MLTIQVILKAVAVLLVLFNQVTQSSTGKVGHICDLNATELGLHSYDTHELRIYAPQKHCAEKWRSVVSRCPYWIYQRDILKTYTQKILFIHVGKSAGTTVRLALEKAHLPFEEIHVKAVRSGMMRHYSDVVIALREPAARLVSSFYWRSPRADSLRHPLIPDPNLQTNDYTEFYDCFYSVNDFAAALYEDSRCGRLAREGEGHIFWNVCAYVGGLADELRQHPRVHVVDSEMILRDINRVLRLSLPGINKNNKKQFSAKNLPTVNSYNKSSICEPLSPENDAIVRRFLTESGVYDMYRTIHEVSFQRGSSV